MCINDQMHYRVQFCDLDFSSIPLTEYQSSFEILLTQLSFPHTHKLVFVAKFYGEKKKSLVCSWVSRGHKAAILLKKNLGHVSVCTRLHGEVFARVTPPSLCSLSCLTYVYCDSSCSQLMPAHVGLEL